MKSIRVVLISSIASGVVAGLLGRAVAEDQPAWKPLSDGTTLAGWHTNGEGEWTVEDGAFVGRSHNAELYGHLVSDDTFKDFTVRFKFQCPSGDSGFFIRTRMEEPDRTIGLQVQVGPRGTGTGGIYESYGRGWLQPPPTRDDEAAYYKEDGWNEMVITAQGNRVVVHVNGVKTADLSDDQIAQEAGVFALQMHSGTVNLTKFKDIEILLPGAFRAGAARSNMPSVGRKPGWVSAWFRKFIDAKRWAWARSSRGTSCRA